MSSLGYEKSYLGIEYFLRGVYNVGTVGNYLKIQIIT